jgi:protein-tyrosine phosphatase
VLPAVDDGAPDEATSTSMIRALHAAGYDLVCATPHQKAAQYLPSAGDIDAAYDRLRAQAPFDLRLGAENFWDDVFFARWREGTIPRYRPTRAFLFEIPVDDVPVRFEETLFQMELQGLLPVMAHPERYAIPFDRLATLAERIPLVVDLGAVAGYHGARAGKIAHKLLTDRVAHAAATDAHTVSDVRAALEGIAWIKKKLGADVAARLLDENPRRILAGDLPDR